MCCTFLGNCCVQAALLIYGTKLVMDEGATGDSSVQQQAEQMIAGVDSNGDKRLSMDEFIAFALKIERTEGPPKPWSIEEEHAREREAKRKRPVVAPEGMSEEEARRMLEAQDATRQDAREGGGGSKRKKKKKKKGSKGNGPAPKDEP